MTRKFIALDTETIRGKAFLLSSAVAVYRIAGWADFIKAVMPLGADFVWYNLDYDVTGLMAHLPGKTAKELYYRGRAVVPGGTCRYIPNKFFAFQPSSHKRTPFRFYDLYSFFQMSLEEAAKKYLPAQCRKAELPPDFWEDFDESKYAANRELVDAYCMQDSIVLQALADMFFEAIEAANLQCKHYYSPASLAKRYLHQTMGRRKLDLVEWMPTLEKAYFGGRIECHQRGYFPDVTVYDLKSAYPAVMRELPDFRHPRLWYSRQPEAPFYIAECRVETGKPLLPIRSHNRILFPAWRGQQCVITNWEIDMVRRWHGNVEIKKVLNIECPADAVMRAPIDRLYEKRALGGMQKQVFKLVLNSLYGVFAQKVKRWRPVSDVCVAEFLRRRVRQDMVRLFVDRQALKCPEAGRHWERNCRCETCQQTRRVMRAVGRSRLFELGGDWEVGFFARHPMRTQTSNMLYAIYTTAGVRVRLTDVIMQHAGAFVAAATDSVMMLETMPETSGIGGWEKQYSGWACVVGSGVYQTAEAVKFRGFETRMDLMAALRETAGLTIAIPQTRRESLARFSRPMFTFGPSVSLNLITDTEKLLRVDFDAKRFWFDKLNAGKELTERNFQSRPFLLGREI